MTKLSPAEWDKLAGQGRAFIFDAPYNPRRLDWKDDAVLNPVETVLLNSEPVANGWLAKMCAPDCIAGLNAITTGCLSEEQPYWKNDWFESFDALSIYGLVHQVKPKSLIEIGSGNSTKFARQAIKDACLATKLTSIDKKPRAEVDILCDTVIRQNLEDVDLDMFSELDQGDILFIDTSHRSFPGSDVTIFFTRILPRLRVGVIWGLHDIFLPDDYPPGWEGRMYNEQYLLMTYLMGGGAQYDEIQLPVAHLSNRWDIDEIFVRSGFNLEATGKHSLEGGCFWMKRVKEMPQYGRTDSPRSRE